MAKLSLAYLEGEIQALKAKVSNTPKWMLYAIIGAVVVLVALYVRLVVKQAQIEKKYQNIEVLNSRFDSLQTMLKLQHEITIRLLRKDSLENLTYEDVVKKNKAERETAIKQTNDEIKEMRDAVNSGNYAAIINKYWPK